MTFLTELATWQFTACSNLYWDLSAVAWWCYNQSFPSSHSRESGLLNKYKWAIEKSPWSLGHLNQIVCCQFESQSIDKQKTCRSWGITVVLIRKDRCRHIITSRLFCRGWRLAISTRHLHWSSRIPDGWIGHFQNGKINSGTSHTKLPWGCYYLYTQVDEWCPRHVKIAVTTDTICHEFATSTSLFYMKYSTYICALYVCMYCTVLTRWIPAFGLDSWAFDGWMKSRRECYHSNVFWLLWRVQSNESTTEVDARSLDFIWWI